MEAFLEELEGLGADSRLYLKPVGFLNSPQYFDQKNKRLNNSLIWFSQIETTVYGAGVRAIRALVDVSDWPELSNHLLEHLAERAETLFTNLTRAHQPLQCGERTLRFDQPHVMGILNMTPDSFSDGGKHDGDPDEAAAAGVAMAAAGASILDIGGESTRPGAEPVWEGDEIKRVVPVIERLAHCGYRPK